MERIHNNEAYQEQTEYVAYWMARFAACKDIWDWCTTVREKVHSPAIMSEFSALGMELKRLMITRMIELARDHGVAEEVLDRYLQSWRLHLLLDKQFTNWD